jgi:hypothetical protein
MTKRKLRQKVATPKELTKMNCLSIYNFWSLHTKTSKHTKEDGSGLSMKDYQMTWGSSLNHLVQKVRPVAENLANNKSPNLMTRTKNL